MMSNTPEFPMDTNGSELSSHSSPYAPMTADAAFQLPPEGLPTLSFEQQRLWVLTQMLPDMPISNVCVTIHLPGQLDVAVLERSLNEVIKRHDIWRTNFPLIDGQLVQVIHPSRTISLPLVDLRNLRRAEREAESLRRANLEAQHIFDLAEEPLLRALLVRLDRREHRLFLTLHRIIADDMSLTQTFLPELRTIYEALSTNQPVPLSPLPIQYAHYAHWQREKLRECAETQLAYWKQQLEHAPTGLALPADHPRSAVPTYRGSTVPFALSADLTDALRMMSRQEDATLYTSLAAAFQVLLYRYTGQDDLLIGTMAENRKHAALQNLMGPFLNPLVLRTNMSGNPTFHELLQRVHEVITAAQAHSDLPFTDVLKELLPEMHGTQKALFQVLMSFVPASPYHLSDWSISWTDVHTGTSQFDLSLELYEHADGLAGRFVYNSDLFDETTITRMAEHWQILLESIIAQPAEPIGRLPLLSETERHLLLTAWNATAIPYPVDTCMHQLFEAQVKRSPHAAAVICQEEQVTYRELNRRANQLAHHLRSQGVGPDTLVALLAERDIPVLVAILAVFKAGGAYLPLDPRHPEARLRRMIEQSRCPFVLTSADLALTLSRALEEMPDEARPRCISLEDFPKTSSCDENLPTVSTPAHLAYIIYTSGSTGLPKGAMVEQRGMLNHLYAKIDALGLTSADTVAQTASQCFDISVWQFLATLLIGGCVRIYPDDVAHDPAQLLRQVDQQQVSILETVPSLLRAVLDAQEGGASGTKLDALRWMVPTGEALPVDLCRRWLARYPHVPLLNAYGPTECSDDVTHYAIYYAPDEGCSSIPIGKAIPNMQLYVLDRYMEPQPIGVAGEIYVGGIGVGRGYLDDEQRTAEVFVPDPFSGKEGARLYKTGDLGRYLPDGNLEFLGRVDFQVKLRGYRIEPGEIEAVLSQHPAVREAAVVIREDAPGDQRLVAYVALHQNQTVPLDELKNQVMKQMPIYMVPSAFVLLETLPLTSNGKLDRSALPAPDPAHYATQENFVAPRLLAHHKLVQMWEELLGVRPIGITDNFFSLGGHSFLAAQLVGRIEQAFGKKVALSTLFAGPTVEQVARALEQQEHAGSRTPVIAVQKGESSRQPFFFLHGDWTGGAFYCFTLARALGTEQPFYVLEPYKIEQHIPSSLEAMAAEHIASLRSVQPEGPYLLGGFCNGGLIAYEMARQLHAQGERVDPILVIPEAPAGFKWLRDAIAHVGSIMNVHQEVQMNWFLYLRHAMRHLYRQVYTSSERVQDFDQLLAIDPRLTSMFPPVDALRRDYVGVFAWLNAGYLPTPYPEEITFFWCQAEPGIRAAWRKVVKIKEKEVQIIPGTHMAGVTKYIHILAEKLSNHFSRMQENVRGF